MYRRSYTGPTYLRRYEFINHVSELQLIRECSRYKFRDWFGNRGLLTECYDAPSLSLVKIPNFVSLQD